ncbi:MAG: hypothetical protein WA871_12890 [Candidatus Acidiferrales bacterium]
MTRNLFAVLLLLALGAVVCPGIAAQGNATGPMTEPPPRDVMRIPTHSIPEASAIPPDEIIKRFAAKEDAFARASRGFGYRKSIVVEEIGDDGKATGQVEVVTTPFYGSDGKRYERVVGGSAEQAQPSAASSDATPGPPVTARDLHFLHFAPEDVVALALMPQFPFTTDQLAKYTITYEGRQKVDELNTYVFSMEPKQVDRMHAYFSGVVWVDDQELAIVKTYGKWVSELGDVKSPQLPFVTFETYRQPVGDNWFPAYSRSDDQVTTKDAIIPIRLIIRWTDYAAVPTPPVASNAGNAAAPSAAASGH